MKCILRIFLTVAVFAISSRADVIYNTFGPDYGVGDSTLAIQTTPHYEAAAMPFAPTTDVVLTQLDLGFYSYGSGANNIEIDLASDSGGLPGNTIQSWEVTFVGTDQHISTLLSNASLQANAQYWVTVKALDDQTDVGWFVNPLNLTGPVGYNFNNGQGWEVFPDDDLLCLDVFGTPAPEPGSLCLMGTAGFGIAGLLRRKL
jgi:hypothetical protein